MNGNNMKKCHAYIPVHNLYKNCKTAIQKIPFLSRGSENKEYCGDVHQGYLL